ncbi:MAG: hypothetical protein WCI67_17625 [Chloroflexales bacterium]
MIGIQHSTFDIRHSTFNIQHFYDHLPGMRPRQPTRIAVLQRLRVAGGL